MKQFSILFILVLSICIVIGSQTAQAQSKDEQQLHAIEENRREAIKTGDFKTLGEIYAEDFSAIAGNGSVINRETLFGVFRRNDPSLIFTTDEVSVRVFGKTAIFSGRLTGKTAAGETVSSGRFTHFFVKRKGKWVCVHGQSTPLPR